MPAGIYKRTEIHKEMAKQNAEKRYLRGDKFGFQKEHLDFRTLEGKRRGMEALRKNWDNPEIKAKMIQKMVGRPPTKGMTGKKCSEGTKIKMSISKLGPKNYRWIKDRETLIRNKRNDPEYKQLVKKVKKRDKNICRINNQDCSGYCIVHHILSWSDYPELRYKINNGITLCQAHHPRKRAEEKQLIPFFQELVPVSNEKFA